MSARHRSSNPQPHPAVLSYLRRFETPDMAQSGGWPKEALGTSWDTVVDCGLRLTRRTEDLAWPGMQKMMKKKNCMSCKATSPGQSTSPRRSPTMVTLHDTRFVECRWWTDGWTVKTIVTWRSSASMIPAPDFWVAQLLTAFSFKISAPSADYKGEPRRVAPAHLFSFPLNHPRQTASTLPHHWRDPALTSHPRHTRLAVGSGIVALFVLTCASIERLRYVWPWWCARLEVNMAEC